ncbi:DNA primase [Leucobacter sp. cx-42]|uniref:DNA primase n=1 Tax=unclassified Leucobacter TaxID=2621730 RepID=UPI00165DEE12|nr:MULTISPECIES: DNA primase [unclassified Leucobacter]MBC9954933.1 DNA primase [Leucobacter sp. cx-42]
MRTCEICGRSIVAKNAQARFCSSNCRVTAHRRAKRLTLPEELTSRNRWIRHSAEKKPVDAITGATASSTDPSTWATYAEADTSPHGAGLGFVLGDGIACIDLDHVITDEELHPAAAELVSHYPSNYIEVSPSGTGLHIWGLSPERPGTRRIENGISVERYSSGRYITITKNVYQAGTLLPL